MMTASDSNRPVNISKSLPNDDLVELNLFGENSEREGDRKFFDSRVVGQKQGVEAALDALEMARNPARDPDRPVYVLYELGPSRTGKTLIAEVLAERLHGSRKSMIKINGGSYKASHEVSKLLGAPPGYLGYRDSSKDEAKSSAAKLSRDNLVRSRGNSSQAITVILVDEANLMHPDSDDIWMSIMDKGELDMGDNQVTDFRDCIIIFTSNIGMDKVQRRNDEQLGFRTTDAKTADVNAETASTVMKALAHRYRPEWRNRVDEFVVFEQHGRDQLFGIVQNEFRILADRVSAALPGDNRLYLDADESAQQFLLRSTLSENGNIANLKRSLQKHVVKPIGKLLREGALTDGATIVLQHVEDDDKLCFFAAKEIAERPVQVYQVTSDGAKDHSQSLPQVVRLSTQRIIDSNGESFTHEMLRADGAVEYHIRRVFKLDCPDCHTSGRWFYTWIVQASSGAKIADPWSLINEKDRLAKLRCRNDHVISRRLHVTPL